MKKFNFEDIAGLNFESLDSEKMSRIKGGATQATATIAYSKSNGSQTVSEDGPDGIYND